MKLRSLFLILVFAANFMPVMSRIVADVSRLQIEGETFRAKGVKLSSKSNPAKAWVENLDGTNPSNIPIVLNKKRDAVRVTMPLVNEDTKMYLNVSGGNVPESAPQRYFIIVADNPELDTSTFSNVPTVTGSAGSSVGSTPGPAGPKGATGLRGLPGFIYDGQRDVNPLPDYDEGYYSYNQVAGEINIDEANAVTIIDSSYDSDDIVGLIKGTGSVGQKITFIVDDFFFLALSRPFCSRCRPREAPAVGSIVAPNFFVGPRPLFPTRTIDVQRYQLLPVFPGMVLEFIFDGTQWRIINLPFFFGDILDS